MPLNCAGRIYVDAVLDTPHGYVERLHIGLVTGDFLGKVCLSFFQASNLVCTGSSLDGQYRALSMARSEASNLRHTLKDCGMDAEATIAEGLLAIVERAIQPILGPLRNADNAYEVAKKALEKQFYPVEEPA